MKRLSLQNWMTWLAPLRHRTRPLPQITVAVGPTISARILLWLAAVLPLALVALLAAYVAGPPTLTLILLTVASVLMLANLVKPSPAPAFIAIGLVALFGLAHAPTLPTALGFTTLGYFAFRFGLLAQEVPRTARMTPAWLKRTLGRDLLVIGLTAVAGGMALAAQRLTGCVFTSPSVGMLGDPADLELPTCHPAGSALVVIGAIALLVLALGFTTGRLLRTRFANRTADPEIAQK